MESSHCTNCPNNNSQPNVMVTGTIVNYFKRIWDIINLFMSYMKTIRIKI